MPWPHSLLPFPSPSYDKLGALRNGWAQTKTKYKRRWHMPASFIFRACPPGGGWFLVKCLFHAPRYIDARITYVYNTYVLLSQLFVI